MPRLNYLLTPAQKVDAREALKILDGTEITLVEAARRSVKGQRALRRVSFEVGLDEFVRAKIQEGAIGPRFPSPAAGKYSWRWIAAGPRPGF